MNFVKRFAWVFPAAVLVASSVFALSGHVFAGENSNGAAPLADITLGNASRGVVFGTAAINADGTVAACFNCDKTTTLHLAKGAYQVGFAKFGNGVITATNGFWRVVQPDTLSTGEVNAWCNTADRAGVPNAVFVNCQQEGGSGSMGNSVPVDVPFFLFVSR